MWVPRVPTRSVLHVILVAIAFAAARCGSTSTSVIGPSGSKCEVSVKNNTPELAASGGNGSVTVTTSRECSWSASTEAPWISLAVTSGQGPGTVNYSVLPNPSGTPRHGRVVVAEQTIDVAQAAAACRYGVNPSSVNVDAAGRQLTIG